MLTFLSGYLGQFQTLATIRGLWTVRFLHPEQRKRFIRLMVHAKREGRDVGIGEGARSSAVQLAGALARHYPVASGGCCSYGTQRYQLRAGQAHMTFPGGSCHEDTMTPRGATAIDAVGDRVWAHQNAHRFGLRTFLTINQEIWHHQPLEQPSARRDWTPWQVANWPTPAQTWRKPRSKKPGPKFEPLPRPSVRAARAYSAARKARPVQTEACSS